MGESAFKALAAPRDDGFLELLLGRANSPPGSSPNTST